MSKNQVLPTGKEISLPVPSGLKSGDPVKVGSLVGVLKTDRADSTVVPATAKSWGGGNPDGYASVWTEGVFRLPVPDAVAGPGTPIYITATNTLTTTVGSNTLFGHTVPVINRGAAEGASKLADAGTAGTVNVRISQV